MDFLVLWNSEHIFAKIIPARPLRPYLWSQLALTAKTSHFQGQTIPRVGKPPLLLIFICYSSPSFLVIRNSDLIFAKILPGRPFRPYLWSSWASRPKRPIFKVKLSPK